MRNCARKMALTALIMIMTVAFGAVAQASAPVAKMVKATSIRLSASCKTLYYTTVMDDPLNAKREYRLNPRILPASASANADRTLIEYKSSSPSVASVDQEGRILALKSGSTVVTAKLNDGSKRYARIKVTVKSLPVQSITLNVTSGKIQPKETVQLDPTISPVTVKNPALGYTSSNKGVATVSNTGLIKGVAPGTAKITVYAKSKTSVKATYKVTVDWKYRVYAISNGAYKKNSKDDLRLVNAKPDLSAIKRVYGAARFDGGGVKINTKTDLTASGIRSFLKTMKNSPSIEGDDVTIFYYSGHGMGDASGTGYNGALVGVDAVPGNIKTSALVTIGELTNYLSQVPGQVIVILDSCYSGELIQAKGTTNEGILRAAKARLVNQEIVSAFKTASSGGQSGAITAKDLVTSPNAQFHVITGCGNSQLSYTMVGWASNLWDEDTWRSLLTYSAEEGTSGTVYGELRADTNNDRIVSIRELYQYTKPRVQQLLQGSAYIQEVQMWSANDAFGMFALN